MFPAGAALLSRSVADRGTVVVFLRCHVQGQRLKHWDSGRMLSYKCFQRLVRKVKEKLSSTGHI